MRFESTMVGRRGSLAFRPTEVMRNQPMLVAIYDRKEEGPPDTWKASKLNES